MHRFVLAALAAFLLAPAAGYAAKPASPVLKLKQQQFGHVLATPGKLALYTWTPEKKD